MGGREGSGGEAMIGGRAAWCCSEVRTGREYRTIGMLLLEEDKQEGDRRVKANERVVSIKVLFDRRRAGTSDLGISCF